MLKRAIICLAGAASLLSAAPARAQGYTYWEIPWGISRSATAARLRALGFQGGRDTGGGRLEFSRGSTLVIAAFDGNSLAGIQENIDRAAPQAARTLFRALADSLGAALGRADSSGAELRIWKRLSRNERLSLELWTPSGSSPSTVYVSREGPGYAAYWRRFREELAEALREDWAAARAPANRWQVLRQNAGEAMFYERAGARRTPTGTWRVWVRTVMRDPVTAQEGWRLDLYMGDDEVDCAGRRMRRHEFVAYLGERVVRSGKRVTPWSPWHPEPMGEGPYEVFCRRMRTAR
ncbi:MAG TPA: surface-adhesin E family protein [Longimicrobium sp.]|nr:surface-adhesin E family protein [Longimicrobium sp.]